MKSLTALDKLRKLYASCHAQGTLFSVLQDDPVTLEDTGYAIMYYGSNLLTTCPELSEAMNLYLNGTAKNLRGFNAALRKGKSRK